MIARVFKVAYVVAFVLLIVGITRYHQDIADWWFLRSYEPSPAVAELAHNAAMSDEGKDYFYVSDPQINNKEAFNRNCPTVEKTFILGCYTSKRIYVLEVNREELDGIMEVTAAHEMLHAAYDRLGVSERSRVTDLLEEQFEQVEDKRTVQLIEQYEEEGGDRVRRNELHSILPTQIAKLSPELEEYFSQYFTDRKKVVELYNEYKNTFERVRGQIDFLQNEIEGLRSRIDNLETQITNQRQQINELNSRLQRHEQQNNTQAYNALVPEQNAAVEKYNSLVNQYRSLISRHNRKVEELNEIVLLQNELVNSMDSTYQPL